MGRQLFLQATAVIFEAFYKELIDFGLFFFFLSFHDTSPYLLSYLLPCPSLLSLYLPSTRQKDTLDVLYVYAYLARTKSAAAYIKLLLIACFTIFWASTRLNIVGVLVSCV